MDKSLKSYLEVYEKGGEHAGMAAYQIAEIYEADGKDKEAFEWYKKSADEGYDRAMIWLGAYYLDGKIISRNEGTAIAWFREAYEQYREAAGLAAQRIGSVYSSLENYKEALEWYQKGAELGDDGAMCELGDCYLMGMGVEKDHIKAWEWYLEAHKKRGPAAERASKAMWLIYKVGGLQQKEMEQFLHVADLDNEWAMLILGNMYKRGEVVEQNLDEARECYRKVYEKHGFAAEEAAAAIKELEGGCIRK